MASEQAIAVNYDHEQKEIVQKMIEDATRIAKSSSPDNATLRTQTWSTVVSMVNTASATPAYAGQKNWAGQFVSPIPNVIPNNSPAVRFTHSVAPINGSQAAVVYEDITSDVGILVAWISPIDMTPNNPNRVYVKVGRIAELPKDDQAWSFIKGLLDGAPTTAIATDPASRTIITAVSTPSNTFNAVGVTIANY